MKVHCQHCKKVFRGTPEKFAAAGWWQMAGPLGLCARCRAKQDAALEKAKAEYLKSQSPSEKRSPAAELLPPFVPYDHSIREPWK